MSTLTRQVAGWKVASAIASTLVRRNAWFECTPLPDDVYRFKVKDDGIGVLIDAIGISVEQIDAPIMVRCRCGHHVNMHHEYKGRCGADCPCMSFTP